MSQIQNQIDRIIKIVKDRFGEDLRKWELIEGDKVVETLQRLKELEKDSKYNVEHSKYGFTDVGILIELIRVYIRRAINVLKEEYMVVTDLVNNKSFMFRNPEW